VYKLRVADFFRLRGAAFSADGKTLVTCEICDEESLVSLWDVKTGKSIRRLPAGRGTAYAAASSPDGKTLAVVHGPRSPWDKSSSEEYGLTLRDAVTGKELRLLRRYTDPFAPLAFSPDGKTLAAVQFGVIELYDVATGKRLNPRRSHEGAVASLAFGPNKREIVSAGCDAVRFWDDQGKLRRTLPLECASVSSLDPRGKRVAWLDEDRCPHVCDLATGKEGPKLSWITTAASPQLTFLGDTSLLACYGNGFQIWDTRRGKAIETPKEDAIRAALGPDGRTLAVGCSFYISIHDLLAGKQIHRIPFDYETDWPAGKEGRSIVSIGEPMTDLLFSADGQTLVSNHHDRTIRIWEVRTGKARGKVIRHPIRGGLTHEVRRCYPIALSPDGRILASGGYENDLWEAVVGAVRLWDVATGEELCRLSGHEGAVVSLAFSPDGKRLVSGSADTTALVWDVGSALAGRKARPAPSPKRLRACWDDLASDDASKAHAAVWDLAAVPTEAAALLADRVEPVPVVPRRRLRRWVADLDSDDQETRETATDRLRQAGESALAALRGAAKSPSAEVRRRALRLLADLERPVPPRETLRALRAVEALEHVGTPEAKRLLRKLAGGAPEARLTLDADTALRRLADR
jgi:WD40 repeat protein